MAKAKAASEAAPVSLLPLPAPLLEAHLEILGPAMRQWTELKRVPPVLLLTGPTGIGKREICHYLGQWLLCERSSLSGSESEEPGLFGAAPSESSTTDTQATSNGPCGACLECQKALHGTWVNFTEISADSSEGENATLKIDQFRAMKASLGFGAFAGRYKIILIRGADRMTPQAANSLLKILEEPPPGWVFLLTAADPALLLPTLVSRCQKLRLRPISAETLEKLIATSGASADRQAVAARLSGGSWGRALSWTDDAAWEQRKKIFDFIERPQIELGAVVDWASQEPKHFEQLLDQLEQSLAEFLRKSLKTAGYAWEAHDGKRALESSYQAALKKFGGLPGARNFWSSLSERICRARQEALAPLNRKLLLQDLLIPWLELQGL